MKLHVLSAVGVLALASLACQPPSQQAAALSDEDRAAIEGAIQTYGESALAGDLDTWAALWTEDAMKMNPNMEALEGRESIREWFAGLPPLTSFTADVVEMDGRGDLAWARGTFSMSMVIEGMPEPMREVGKYLTIMEKQPDGRWLIAIDIWNSDLPLPGAESET
jgi:uncharacterized protein (TIGR02246 family)